MKQSKLLNDNKQFEVNNWNWSVDHSTSFKIIKRKWIIMLSAPHAVNHFRNWELLQADILTWWLAVYLSEKFDLPCIYSTSSNVWDPNYDEYETSDYKKELIRFLDNNNIKLLIDLHGCWSQRDFAIELWTWWDNNPNLLWNAKLLNRIKSSLEASLKSYLAHNKTAITVNTIFPASNKNTISAFISQKGNIPAVQIEINKSLRDEKNLEKLIASLEILLSDLNQYFSN